MPIWWFLLDIFVYVKKKNYLCNVKCVNMRSKVENYEGNRD